MAQPGRANRLRKGDRKARKSTLNAAPASGKERRRGGAVFQMEQDPCLREHKTMPKSSKVTVPRRFGVQGLGVYGFGFGV